MEQTIQELEILRTQSQNLDTRQFLRWALQKFPSAAFATSLGAEDQALLWLLQETDLEIKVFSLDTGRLPEETYDLLQRNKAFFRLPIKTYSPDAAELEALIAQGGPNLFYESLDKRKSCCAVRKVAPLKRALKGHSAWITGMRRNQSSTRLGLERLEWDEANGIYKLNPLADWSHTDVWDLIEREHLPYNALHDKGYPSLGCAPCTRAVKPGDDERSGRWWWENPENKECGIHVQNAEAAPARKPVGGIGMLKI